MQKSVFHRFSKQNIVVFSNMPMFSILINQFKRKKNLYVKSCFILFISSFFSRLKFYFNKSIQKEKKSVCKKLFYSIFFIFLSRLK